MACGTSEQGKYLWLWLQQPRIGVFASAAGAFKNCKKERFFASLTFHPVNTVVWEQYFKRVFL